ncbi:sulfurtransferase [Solemya velum gill symbiont]|uniref:rhodanese-like domain-containing protein n=1 Tax=Solemya velum gill symbiont TaxID=2340 RepID=UPI000997751A|nr:rhodanese-like domain-containing protein [Solemya velum gill symbiont]OOZ74875.1 sulfurtransferase [Solemya velum gill symbiont]
MNTELHEISPKAAWEMIKNDPRTVLIDVRSSMEYLFVGHPKGAVHVPWIDEPDWDINPLFTTDVRKLMLGGLSCDKEDGCVPVILICRSGKRSREAGEVLVENGLKNIYNIDEGFEGELDDDHHRSTVGGWRFHGLPWEQC